MSTSTERMAALTAALAAAGPEAGEALQDVCRTSAEKAVNEVLRLFLDGSDRDPMNGTITLRITQFSELVVERTVRDAITRCCD